MDLHWIKPPPCHLENCTEPLMAIRNLQTWERKTFPQGSIWYGAAESERKLEEETET